MPFASTEHRGQLRDGLRCDERRNRNSMGSYLDDGTSGKAVEDHFLLPGESVFLMQRSRIKHGIGRASDGDTRLK